MRPALIAALLLGALVPVLAPGPAAAARCLLPAALDSQTHEMLDAVNAQRAAAGLAPLAASAKLGLAAQGHACDLAARRHFTHTGFDGSTPERRIARAGFEGCGAEMIARGEASAQVVIMGWQVDDSLRALLLDPMATALGTGLALSESQVPMPYWVVLVGGPCKG